MLLQLEELSRAVEKNPSLKTGCIVDTNLLFAATFPLDTFNEWAESVFQRLHELKIPVFTNMNVRSEFIELNRRVLIPEGLVEMYSDLAGTLQPELEQQLKSLKTMKDKAAKKNQTFKLNDGQIKSYKKLLSRFSFANGENAWDTFCEEYFFQYIMVVWDATVAALELKFLGTREIEFGEHFASRPRWKDMVEIVGRTGIGSADAMNVNLFEHSKLTIMVTTDKDVRDAVISRTASRFVIAPQY